MVGFSTRATRASSRIEDLVADLTQALPGAHEVPAAPPEALRSPA